MNLVQYQENRRGFFYGLRFAIVIATAFWALFWALLGAGCAITENMETSYGRGKNAALLAVALIDSESDQNRLAIIADDITAFLADPDRPLSVEIINQYTSGLTEKSGLTQGQIALVTMALSAELQGAGGNHREFLRGVRDILIFLVPPPISQGMENEIAPHPLAPISAEFEAALNAVQGGHIGEATASLLAMVGKFKDLEMDRRIQLRKTISEVFREEVAPLQLELDKARELLIRMQMRCEKIDPDFYSYKLGLDVKEYLEA